jgi:hypothetical protein
MYTCNLATRDHWAMYMRPSLKCIPNEKRRVKKRLLLICSYADADAHAQAHDLRALESAFRSSRIFQASSFMPLFLANSQC